MNPSWSFAITSILASAMIFTSGALFVFRLHSPWSWLFVLAALIIAAGQANVHFERNELMRRQHELIQHAARIAGSKSGAQEPDWGDDLTKDGEIVWKNLTPPKK